MWTRTKIVCTIGPAVNTLEMLIELAKAGMNVARLNFSHGTHEEHLTSISLLKQVREQLNIPLAIMLDTKGPEIRVGKISGGEIHLTPGTRWLLVKEPIEGDGNRISITPDYILDKLQVGTHILFVNGYISSHVIETRSDGVLVEIEKGGVIKSNQGVNIPNVSLGLPAMTERDKEDIKFGCEQDIDIIAASFVRSADHVLAIKELLEEHKKADILVVAKIESTEGIENFDSILQVADGIMVARGDLGVEVPLSQVPKLQKMMIRKSCIAGKPTVTATQMLESMIYNPRPTRAETSDVANAIYDGTSSVMLSGETAVGLYPIETVKVMKSIIQESETDFDYQLYFDQHSNYNYHDVPSAITLATVKTAYSSNAKAIFVFTTSGSTARLLSRFRPSMPIIAMTPKMKGYHQMSFYWGTIPWFNPDPKTLEEAFHAISTYALERQYASYGDLVVVTAGTPFGISGTTNMMLVESIGEVLVRGHDGIGHRVHGNVVMVLSPEARKPYAVRGQILVLAECNDAYLSLIKESSAVILQNHIDDKNSETCVLQAGAHLGKTVLVRADGAMEHLKEGMLVTVDPEKSLVYKGVVL